MKKILGILAAAALLLAFAACGAPAAKDTLTGTPEEILAQLKEDPKVELGMTFDEAVKPDGGITNPQNALGLTDEQFAQYVEAAFEAKAAIMTHAQSTSVIKCKSAADAADVKKLIAAGFDSNKWICVFPEQSVVVESGSYLLLAVGEAEATNALVEAFKTLSGGNIGTPDVFFTFDGEG
jgi:hypothetical protein